MKRFGSLAGAFLIIIGMVLPLHVGLAQDDTPVSEEVLAQFDAVIQAEMAYLHIPGAAVAVIQDGDVVYAQGFGVRDITTGEPFTPQTQFRIGSTTKSMTSLMIAQLVDEGALDWDTLVVDVYPDFQTSDPELTAKLTIRDLMSMGTGLESDNMASLGWGQWTETDLFATIADMVVAGDYRQHYSYNNEVYTSAAYVALAAAGEAPTLDQYIQTMQTRLFDPVGMSSTLITDDRSALSDNYAESYSFTFLGDITEPFPVLPAPINVVAPAGAVWSTLDDMARYMITQMNGGVTPDGARIVSDANLAVTWEPQIDMPAGDPEIERLSYGMGWIDGSYKGISLRFHDGGWDGYRTIMAVLPDTQTGLVIFCNHIFGDMFNYGLMYAFAELVNGDDPAPLLDEVNGAFDENYGSIDAQLAVLPPPEVDPDAVAPLLGSYEQGWELTVRDDGLLWLTVPDWEFILRALPGDNLYLISSGTAIGAMVQFDLKADPVTMSIEFQGSRWPFAKVD